MTNSFIGLCSENAISSGIADVITNCLDKAKHKSWKEKLICIHHNSTDNLIDLLTYIHCYTHVLDQCLKDTIKGNGAAVKDMTLIEQLSIFYRTSPKLS